MNQRTISCACGADPYPLSHDKVIRMTEAITVMVDHAHRRDPVRNPPPDAVIQLPRQGATRGYISVLIDGPRNGEVLHLDHYVDDIFSHDRQLGVHKPVRSTHGHRTVHYIWQPTPR